jgi:transposase-like protein
LATLVRASLRSGVGCWMEIITGVERRRRWRIEDKLRIVAEAETPGAIISHVARRHHISRGLLSNWRQQVRRGALAADDHSAVFMPVRMLSEPMSSSPAVAVPREQNGVAGVVAEDRRIEIALPDGTCIRVGANVGLVALRRVISAVRR